MNCYSLGYYVKCFCVDVAVSVSDISHGGIGFKVPFCIDYCLSGSLYKNNADMIVGFSKLAGSSVIV